MSVGDDGFTFGGWWWWLHLVVVGGIWWLVVGVVFGSGWWWWLHLMDWYWWSCILLKDRLGLASFNGIVSVVCCGYRCVQHAKREMSGVFHSKVR